MTRFLNLRAYLKVYVSTIQIKDQYIKYVRINKSHINLQYTLYVYITYTGILKSILIDLHGAR